MTKFYLIKNEDITGATNMINVKIYKYGADNDYELKYLLFKFLPL